MTGGSLYLLDTNVVGFIVSGRSQAARSQLAVALAADRIIISSVTEAEILFGLERRLEAIRLRSAVSALLNSVVIRPWDSSAAQAYARLRMSLSSTGKSLSVMDLLIASHAIALGAILVSHDQAFFQLSNHLRIVDWATDL